MFRVSRVYLPRTWDHFARHSLKQDRADPDLGDCAQVIVKVRRYKTSFFLKSELTTQNVAIQLYNESVTVSLYSNMHD